MDTIANARTRSAEAAEAEIGRFIVRMDTKRRDTEGERLEEELWRESVRRVRARSEAAMRERWVEYHRHLQVLHQSLADEHEQEAEKLEGT